MQEVLTAQAGQTLQQVEAKIETEAKAKKDATGIKKEPEKKKKVRKRTNKSKSKKQATVDGSLVGLAGLANGAVLKTANLALDYFSSPVIIDIDNMSAEEKASLNSQAIAVLEHYGSNLESVNPLVAYSIALCIIGLNNAKANPKKTEPARIGHREAGDGQDDISKDATATSS